MLPHTPISTLFPYTTLFRSFDGKQTNTFTEINYQKSANKTDWIFGANLYTSDFDENDNATLQRDQRSEEHTSELQSRGHLVCRLLLEKKNHVINHDLRITV